MKQGTHTQSIETNDKDFHIMFKHHVNSGTANPRERIYETFKYEYMNHRVSNSKSDPPNDLIRFSNIWNPKF